MLILKLAMLQCQMHNRRIKEGFLELKQKREQNRTNSARNPQTVRKLELLTQTSTNLSWISFRGLFTDHSFSTANRESVSAWKLGSLRGTL